jgi:hypothetical protein
MSLTYEEQMNRNLELTEMHLKALLDHPELLDTLPEGATVIYLPADDPELREANRRMAMDIVREVGRNGSSEVVVLVLISTDGDGIAKAKVSSGLTASPFQPTGHGAG